jgi:hypothetical protein
MNNKCSQFKTIEKKVSLHGISQTILSKKLSVTLYHFTFVNLQFNLLLCRHVQYFCIHYLTYNVYVCFNKLVWNGLVRRDQTVKQKANNYSCPMKK